MRTLEELKFQIEKMSPHLTNAGYLGQCAIELMDELFARAEELRQKLNNEHARNSILTEGLERINFKIQNLRDVTEKEALAGRETVVNNVLSNELFELSEDTIGVRQNGTK